MMGFPRAIVVTLTVSVIVLQAEAKRECIKVKAGNIKRLAADTHVLLKVDREFPSGDAEDQYKELCGRYEGTPSERTSNLVIGHFGIDIYGDTGAKKKAKDVAEKFGAGDENEWPTYVLLKKGANDASDAINFEGDPSADELTNFLRDETDIRVGAMLYYIETLDRCAARFMGVDENGGKKSQLKKHLYAYVAKIMIFLYRGDAKEVATFYGNTFSSILKEGNDYATKNTDRLDGMLSSDRNMSNLKREEVAQRLHILKKFTEPVEVSAEENRSFYFALCWYTVLLGSMVLMFISMIFFEEKGGNVVEAADTSGKGENKGEKTETATKKDQ